MTIVSYSPANNTFVSGVTIPIVLEFSDNVLAGEGYFVIKNSFGDVEEIPANSTQVVFGEKNVTVSSGKKYFYGSTNHMYFKENPVVDNEQNPIVLTEGMYLFSINSSNRYVV